MILGCKPGLMEISSNQDLTAKQLIKNVTILEELS